MNALIVEQIFHDTFYKDYKTKLKGGADEPFYLPKISTSDEAVLFYRYNYVNSALHEVAHWCIAGPQRRQQEDFGYEYQPDGRDLDSQARFEAWESQPQSLEWIFAQALGVPFFVSTDNLVYKATPSLAFRRNIRDLALTQLGKTDFFRSRRGKFTQALYRFSGREKAFTHFWGECQKDKTMLPR